MQSNRDDKQQSSVRRLGWLHRLSRFERKVLVAWIRFARRHRTSNRLPIVLFFILFLDGFLIVIPSSVCVVAAITISPARWFLFGTIFAVGGTLNCTVTYFIGRLIPAESILATISYFHLDHLWQSAQQALHQHGPFAAFIGALIGLPTQMITMILGIADEQALKGSPDATTVFLQAIAFVLLGNAIKAYAISFLARFGWLRLEKKYG